MQRRPDLGKTPSRLPTEWQHRRLVFLSADGDGANLLDGLENGPPYSAAAGTMELPPAGSGSNLRLDWDVGQEEDILRIDIVDQPKTVDCLLDFTFTELL